MIWMWITSAVATTTASETDMDTEDKLMTVAFIAALIVLALDVFVWRP